MTAGGQAGSTADLRLLWDGEGGQYRMIFSTPTTGFLAVVLQPSKQHHLGAYSNNDGSAHSCSARVLRCWTLLPGLALFIAQLAQLQQYNCAVQSVRGAKQLV